MQTLVTTQRRWALGAALVALLAIVWGSLGDRVLGGPATVMAWRVATVALIGVLAYKAPLLRAMWQGRLHVSCDTVRSIPFCDSEMRRGRFHPAARRFGAQGQLSVAGLGLLLLGLILWCGGLGFGALNATGSLQLTPGVPAQVVTQDGSEHLVLLDHHHTLIEVDEDARSGSRGPIWRRRGQAEIRVEHPTTRAQAVYHLSPRESIGFQDYRISALSVRPEEVTLRFAERWVWWWRVLVLGLTVVGYLLLIAVPYRAWLWLGRSGDYQLRAWSFNAGRSTPSAVNRRLEGALGPEESAELSAIERAMKISTQPGGAERLQMADPALVLRLFVVPLAALLGLAHELVAAAPGTGVSPLALGVAAAVLLLNDVRWI